MDTIAEKILTFWFGTVDLSREIERRPVWFKATLEFDADLARDFAAVHEEAARGDLDRFVDDASECLALIIALDQFPRNLYRGTPRSYATDAKARSTAVLALDRGYDRGFSHFPRIFTYLPFEHSEALADQERAVELFSALGEERSTDSAIAHRDAIRRFGRFPHRNRILGRSNTPEEDEYLKDPPLWGMTAAEAAELEERKARAAEEATAT